MNNFEQVWVDDTDITSSASVVRDTNTRQEVEVSFPEPSSFAQISIKGSQDRSSGQNIGVTCTCTRTESIWNTVTGNPVDFDWKLVSAAGDNLPINWFFYSFNGGTDMSTFASNGPRTTTCAASIGGRAITTGGSNGNFFGFYLKVNQICT